MDTTKKYMMDDPISRKAAIETLALNTDYQTPDGIKNDLINHPGKECDWLGGIDEAISIIEELPSIPAVPLDELCELLAKNADCPPEHSPIMDHCIENKCAECWKTVLKEWVEE